MRRERDLTQHSTRKYIVLDIPSRGSNSVRGLCVRSLSDSQGNLNCQFQAVASQYQTWARIALIKQPHQWSEQQ